MSNLTYTIKEMFRNVNKQKIIFLASIIFVMIIIIVVISIVVKVMGIKISYSELEQTLATATEKYMNEHPSELPTENNPAVVINATTLVENKYIKEIGKLVKDNSCTANVNVYYEKGKYQYQPYVTCNSFKTENFIDTLKSQNEISSFGEGLYEINGELVFRGQNPNNYLKFADELWRIVKVNKEGQFLIIKNDLESTYYGTWDDRYNTEAGTQKGVNNYSLSRALSTIKTVFQEKYSSYLTTLLSTYNVCAEKRGETDIKNDGSIECNKTLNNQYIGLLPLYDYINASLDELCTNASSKECQNYNYLVNSKDKWWTATGNTKNTFNVYYINYYGQITTDEAAASANYRYVLALNKNVLYKSGSGTSADPYEVR